MGSKFIKAITLSSFIILMAGFVAYRSDAFDTGTVADEVRIDSPIVENSDPAMLSSSKSAVIFKESKKTIQHDTIKKTKVFTKTESDSLLKTLTLMTSSKSGAVFFPKTSIDTTNIKKVKQEDHTSRVFLQEKNIMSSSKSVILASPLTLSYTPLIFPVKK